MPEFEPRRAKPGQAFGYTTAEGRQREIRADDDGVVRPKTAEDKAALDTFDLPVAHVDEPAAENPSKADKASGKG